MNASELMTRVIAYGADEHGIRDRFGNNDELYQICFMDFLDEPNVDLLRRSIAEKEYECAFEAAHALKGVSGNLGVTAYYSAICVLVESLRAKSCSKADEEYEQVERQFARLLALSSDEAPAPVADEIPAAQTPSLRTLFAQLKAHIKPQNRFIPATAVVLMLILALMLSLFNRLTLTYKDNVATESASHLGEINHQIQQSVEDSIETDWMLAHTISFFFSESSGNHDEQTVLRLLESIRETWGVTDLSIYTDDGCNICLDGEAEPKDVALNRAARARELGEYMTIVDSDITYTVPVQSLLTYKGSPIAAISIVKNMRSFLDDMEFSSFGSAAYLYLTDNTGKVFSKLSGGASSDVFNVMPLFGGEFVSAVTNEPVDKGIILTAQEPTVLMTADDYVVTTAVSTRRNDFRLIYIVPTRSVNATMDNYTASVTTTSFIVLFIFAASALLIIIYQYRVKKKQFDSAIMAREHMFDLLVHSSRTAFGLFELNRASPVYISNNCGAIMAEPAPVLLKADAGFMMRGESGAIPPAFEGLNEGLRGWDGVSPYRSGFIENADPASPGYFELQLFPIDSEADEYVGIAQDVTQLQAREDDIRTALVLSERGSEAKTRFLSNMSHDIRTPMNAIVNMADFAVDEMNNPVKLRECLKTIRESSDHLLLLINDILEMSRIESGKAEIACDPFDLKAELERLNSIVLPLCAEKEQTLRTDIANFTPSVVLGDQVKVAQILMNLLSNAVKFTPRHGTIRFTCRELPSLRAEYVCTRFIVEDTGIGISAEHLRHIFEPFFRADEKRVSGVQGTGLGLSICHSYVVAMGGQIKCESRLNKGSVFTVDLYFKRTDRVPEGHREFSPQDVRPFAGKRCLLCEDNPTNRLIATTVLERLGFTVETAGDGLEGLRKFRNSDPGLFDVIYMDIQMPVMDGYESAVAIRACQRGDAASVAIIAMTANVFMEDIEKAHIAGMDGHVGKPVSTAAIANETSRVLNQKRRMF